MNALKPPPGKREWQLQPIKVHHVVVRQAEAGIREPAEADGTWAEAATREMREWRLQPKKRVDEFTRSQGVYEKATANAYGLGTSDVIFERDTRLGSVVHFDSAGRRLHRIGIVCVLTLVLGTRDYV